MIKNQKQAGITKEKLLKLKADRETFISKKKEYDEFKFKLGINSLDSLINDLETELAEYESLVSGNFNCLHPKSLEEISNVLIAARLAQKMSQKDLGDVLGMKEQQIQRYELTDYETASWTRIVEISKALGIELNFQKVTIVNLSQDEELFQYPDGITAEQVKEAEEKLIKNGSLII
jgi:HTH-type transcriptional regulator/antitoxin HipB